jgi:hypothetical protein
MQYYSPYGDSQPILLKYDKYERKTVTGYDEKFENFFTKNRNDWQTVFFWVRKGMPDVKIDGNKTPRELNMKRYDTAEVHARVMKHEVPNFLVDFGLEDKEPQQKKLKKKPEKPAIVESEKSGTAEYSKIYRMSSGLGYWIPFALSSAMQEKYTPDELGVDPSEVY